jgi:hypothetical protein
VISESVDGAILPVVGQKQWVFANLAVAVLIFRHNAGELAR